MLETIQIAYNSGKAALDIAKGIHSLNSEVERNQAIIDIQRHVMDSNASLMDAQQAYATSLKRIEELENEIVRLKDWAAQMERYELKSIEPNGFAYSQKPGMENGEPRHWLCTNCYQNSQKSILQMKETIGQFAVYHCNRCSGEMTVYARRHPDDED
jgi:hypothetical protein